MVSSSPPRIGIAGVTGYAGYEALRLLSSHPGVVVERLAAGRGAGVPLAESWPTLSGQAVPAVESLSVDWAAGLDAVVLALPHGISGGFVAQLAEAGLLDQGLRVVDLGADFRLRSPEAYEAAYGAAHPAPELLSEAVYGLPELGREAIAAARIVANPGCYPTATALGGRVLLQAGCAGPVLSTCLSGVSGAGRKASLGTAYCEVSESAHAYGVGGVHRHVPEMEQVLGAPVSFSPHLVPLQRGLLATVTMVAPARLTADALRAEALALTDGEPLLVFRDQPPATRDVRGTGCAHLAVALDARRGVAQAFVAIDNLGKGAAAQAVQNLNLVLGIEETAGIPTHAVLP